jgi:hypothetical protein
VLCFSIAVSPQEDVGLDRSMRYPMPPAAGGSGALTGLTSVAENLRKIGIFVAWPTRGPCVAHSKFGPILGIEPVPNGTPCIALRYPATCDSAPPNKRHRALVKDWCLAKPDPSRSNVDRSSQHQRGPKPISLPVSAIGYRLSAIGYRLSAIGYRLSAATKQSARSQVLERTDC